MITRSASPGPCPPPIPWAVGLGAACPEGSRLLGGACQCHEGRVWMPDGSRCVSPQAPAYSGAIPLQQATAGHTPDTYGQQDLTPAARAFLLSQGRSVDCRIDPNWDAGPQGGQPARLCSIDGGPYQHAAYLINLNPYNALVDAAGGAAPVIAGHSGPQPGAPVPQHAAWTPTAGSPALAWPDAAAQPASASASGPQLAIPSALADSSFIPNVPNWAIAAAGVAALFVLSK